MKTDNEIIAEATTDCAILTNSINDVRVACKKALDISHSEIEKLKNEINSLKYPKCTCDKCLGLSVENKKEVMR